MVNTEVVLRSDYTLKDGTQALRLRVTINREVKYYPIGEYVNPKNWENGRVSSRQKNAGAINTIISQWLSKADQVFYQLKIKSKTISHDSFEREFFNADLYDFYKFTEDYLSDRKANYSWGTIHLYNCEISKLKKFRPTLYLSDIDYDFLVKYERHMREELKNQTNTVSKTMKKLRAIVNEACKRELIDKDPFRKYKLKSVPGKRVFLTLDEVDQLEALLEKDISDKLKNVLRYFLFACYTGLRYQDVLDLDHSWINNGVIRLYPHKTIKDNVLAGIPLSERALKHYPEGPKNGKVFRVISSQKTNDALDALTLFTKINKKIRFHTARHTFAMISLNIGIPMEVVGELMGHTNTRTTRIYAKLLDSTKQKEMNKWDNL